MKKKIFTIIAVIIITCIGGIYFFAKNNYKTVEFGNTNIKSIQDIKEYILNISSYEAEVNVEILSNKNSNKYKLKQKYSSPNIFKQEVLEPSNIKGLITTYDGTNLKLENTRYRIK